MQTGYPGLAECAFLVTDIALMKVCANLNALHIIARKSFLRLGNYIFARHSDAYPGHGR